jgi:hypothetical protein
MPYNDKSVFINSEAYQGIPLFEWILKNTGKQLFSENQAALIMREIFQALKEA